MTANVRRSSTNVGSSRRTTFCGPCAALVAYPVADHGCTEFSFEGLPNHLGSVGLGKCKVQGRMQCSLCLKRRTKNYGPFAVYLSSTQSESYALVRQGQSSPRNFCTMVCRPASRRRNSRTSRAFENSPQERLLGEWTHGRLDRHSGALDHASWFGTSHLCGARLAFVVSPCARIGHSRNGDAQNGPKELGRESPRGFRTIAVGVDPRKSSSARQVDNFRLVCGSFHRRPKITEKFYALRVVGKTQIASPGVRPLWYMLSMHDFERVYRRLQGLPLFELQWKTARIVHADCHLCIFELCPISVVVDCECLRCNLGAQFQSNE